DKQMKISEDLFRKVCATYSNTTVYADALYGLGLVMQEEGRFDEALAEYAKIFTCNANENLIDPESSEDYPNYKFKAAIRSSECYEARKDMAKALEFALLAKDRYPFVSYCKDCLLKTRQNIAKRVEQLQAAVKVP